MILTALALMVAQQAEHPRVGCYPIDAPQKATPDEGIRWGREWAKQWSGYRCFDDLGRDLDIYKLGDDSVPVEWVDQQGGTLLHGYKKAMAKRAREEAAARSRDNGVKGLYYELRKK